MRSIYLSCGLAFACGFFEPARIRAAAAEQLPQGAVLRLGADALPSLRGVALSPDGRFAATYGQPANPTGQAVQLWDLRTARWVRTLEGNKRPLRAVTFSPDGSRVAATALDGPSGSGDTCVWSVPAGELLARIEEGGETVRFSPDGETLSVPTPYQVRRYRAATGDEAGRIADLKRGLALARDGGRLLAATHRRDPRLWVVDLKSRRELVMLQADKTEPLAAAISPDGRTVAIENGDNAIALWEVATGQLVCYLRGHERRVFALAFSPDGRWLASGSLDETVRLWEVATGTEAARGVGHTGLVTAVAFSPTGDRLLSASSDRSAILWKMPEMAQSQLGSPPTDEAAFEEFWRDLAAARLRAYTAIGQMQAHPKSLLPAVRERLELMLLPTDSGRIAQLIAELDHPNHLIRDRAMDQLQKLKPSDLSVLTDALDRAASNEARARLQRVLDKHGLPRVSTADMRRAQRIMHAVDSLPLAESRPVLELLIEHFPDEAVAEEARETLERAERTAD